MLRARAFTLIELLVVMAIIIILAALLLSAISHVKASAQAVACRNNLGQWGKATQLYAGDNDDFLPPEGWANPPLVPTQSVHTNSWYVLLPRTIGLPSYYEMPWRSNKYANPGRSIWICPSNPRRSNGTELFHYCLNENANGTGMNNYPTRLVSIPHPDAVVWLFDSKNQPALGGWTFVHHDLHKQGAQFVFLDGHVAWFKNTAYWNSKNNKCITNNPKLVWCP
jgi:prepilin-type N-terminal cleavage/methylation domain-containing protein/prepilin-type processing-associated H-X9-DG protein